MMIAVEAPALGGPEAGPAEDLTLSTAEYATTVAGDATAIAPTHIYSARALIRMAAGDSYHNFPDRSTSRSSIKVRGL